MLPDAINNKLAHIKQDILALPNTPFGRRIKIYVLLLINMRYEKIHLSSHLKAHPHAVLGEIIDEAAITLKSFQEIQFIEENMDAEAFKERKNQEVKHHDLFNVIWDKYNEKEFQSFVARYTRRVEVNDLKQLVQGKRCIDFGCGNGVFCFALLEMGAASVVGIDFGENNIEYARRVAEQRGVSAGTTFKTASVYDTGFVADEFDFAIQNGVFHHLNDQDGAYREVHRVMKPGGAFWCYVNGEGSIASELFALAVAVNEDISSDELYTILTELNIHTGKKAFLTDGFKATYAFTTYEKLTSQLERIGFTSSRRLVGGFPEDYDHDKIASDPYGKVKFGEGNLRVLFIKGVTP